MRPPDQTAQGLSRSRKHANQAILLQTGRQSIVTGRRVLVLRPEPGATETAARLAAAGFEPVVLPLSEIRPLAPALGLDAVLCACVAATSVNALRHAPEQLLHLVRNKPLFAVGETTAQAARLAGFSDVTAGADDGAALAGMVLDSGPDGPVLYFCGKVRRPEFERSLRDGGLEVLPVEVYDALPVDQSRRFNALGDVGGPLIALCHSPEAARMLADLAAKAPALAERLSVIAISARAAQPLTAIGVAVRVATVPTDQAMLALLG